MKIRSLFCSICLLTSSVLQAQFTTCEKAEEVVHTMNKYHYQPKPLDDNFSEMVFNQVLSVLDNELLLFSKTDIESLSVHKHAIDNQISSGTCNFLEDLTLLFEKNLAYLDTFYSELKTAEFDLNSTDFIVLDFELEYQEGEKANKLRKQFIQLEVLEKMISTETEYEHSEDLTHTFQEVLKNIIESKQCALQTRFEQKSINEVVGDAYLQSVCFAYDPHSAYLPNDKKELLSAALSEDALSFGFGLNPRETGYIEVADLSPGGAAWNSNQINEGDVLLSVEGNNQQLDLKCISWIAFKEFMQNPELKEATFSVRKRNQEVVSVFLRKESLEVSANIIRSFVLENSSKRIGYLYLPSFYGDISEYGIPLNGCANDIAKELLRLKKEDIDGLIFDLRDNPGGYMMEAIKLAGIFIDYGALGIAHINKDEPVTLKDPSRGIAYNGPMVVLVNGYSASASELFAAAMQDQNRAIIAGGSTFGKATMQNVIPLENTSGVIQPNEFVKVTLGKFYRVTGKSHQNEGVEVDISIPSEYDAESVKESDYVSALANSEISKKTYYYPKPELPLKLLKRNSTARMDTSAVFTHTMNFTQSAKEDTALIQIPLGYDALKEYLKVENEMYNALGATSSAIFEAKKPSYLEEIFDLEKEENISVIEYLNSDESVKESFRILIDLIHLN